MAAGLELGRRRRRRRRRFLANFFLPAEHHLWADTQSVALFPVAQARETLLFLPLHGAGHTSEHCGLANCKRATNDKRL